MTAGVYLLHFSSPYKHARHYLGYSDNIEQRIADHIAGRGGRLPQVVSEAGIDIICVRMWPGTTRSFERKLKNRKNAPCLCPVCNRRTWRSNGVKTQERIAR
jgi:hypothetical protein